MTAHRVRRGRRIHLGNIEKVASALLHIVIEQLVRLLLGALHSAQEYAEHKAGFADQERALTASARDARRGMSCDLNLDKKGE